MKGKPETFTKRQAQRTKRRHKILQVAGKYFLENGYAATTMSGVATALGGSKETLWNYFSSKEELFVAYLDEATAAFRSRLLPDLDPRTSVREALRRFACRYTEEICSAESTGLHRLVISECVRFPEIGRLFYERAPQATAAFLATYLEAHMAAGTLRRADAVEAANTLLSLCMKDRYQILFGFEVPARMDFETAAIGATEDFLRIYQSAPADASVKSHGARGAARP